MALAPLVIGSDLLLDSRDIQAWDWMEDPWSCRPARPRSAWSRPDRPNCAIPKLVLFT